MPEEKDVFEVRLASGEVEVANSRWGAHHVVARRVAFDANPVDPRGVLPAEIWEKKGVGFAGRVYVETIYTVADLSPNGPA